MRHLCVAILGVAMAACVGSAHAQDDNGKKIVGVWEVTKSASELPPGTTVEFTKDGKLRIALKKDGTELAIDGSYKVEKDKLMIKVKLSEEVDSTSTIKKLTDDALEIEDKDKKLDVLKKKK